MKKQYKVGDTVTAAELNDLVRTVERLMIQGRPAGGNGVVQRTVERRGMRYGFQLGDVNGALHYRRGYIWDGFGGLVAVGDQEWNALEDPGGSIDVWLDVTLGGPGGKPSGEVRVARRDASAASGRLSVRLGYREERAAGVRSVQVAGGLMNPYQPVMARGSIIGNPQLIAAGANHSMRRSDWQSGGNKGRCAGGGCAQEGGYVWNEITGAKMRSDFIMYYYCGMSDMLAGQLPETKGREVRTLRFDNTLYADRDH